MATTLTLSDSALPGRGEEREVEEGGGAEEEGGFIEGC
eukprot:CAMPEP_0113577748 /NCGR_PEP_ID=MMETSP0015_2-20120614/29061_1 /TAXON_ID=2838 /ORGANISM="Odontella" /LENGTH=37 /DNA_ID=CAMNT_0000481403 /DNA_START=56 /DNA_END=169 /DNA_ORIENTATION=- /assembly_acc=CAM_ASM_000160